MTIGEKYNFQYCPKLVIFNKKNEVLLCKRQGEQDFDGVFSFPGGKRESTDSTIEIGIEREKIEEIGDNIKIKVYRLFNIEREYVKKLGDTMILPHYLGILIGGKVSINEEYSEYKWIKIEDIHSVNTIKTVKSVIEDLLVFKKSTYFKESFIYNNFII